MARIPPWRWKLFGPWPPEEGLPQSFPDEQIRPLAERLSKQRPWLSALSVLLHLFCSVRYQYRASFKYSGRA
ncbi:MAG: hypothetical protein RLZZ609_754 [Cyanobacteriota bacterium]|jgi:hypothetical protein